MSSSGRGWVGTPGGKPTTVGQLLHSRQTSGRRPPHANTPTPTPATAVPPSGSSRRSGIGASQLPPPVPSEPVSYSAHLASTMGGRGQGREVSQRKDVLSPIQVVTRIKPQEQSVVPRGDILDVGEDMQTLSVSKDLYFSRTQDFAVHKFTFDRVFPDSTRQRTFYRKCCKPLVMALCQGVNGCIITYGETKTGKTYTLEGPLLSEDPSDQGVIPLAVEDIFEYTHSNSTGGRNFSVRASYLVIENDSISDLLRPGNDNLRVMDDKERGGTTVVGLTEKELHSPVDIYDILRRKHDRRRSKSGLNTETSILTLTLDLASKPRSGISASGPLSLDSDGGNTRVSPAASRLMSKGVAGNRQASTTYFQSFRLAFVELPSADITHGKKKGKTAQAVTALPRGQKQCVAKGLNALSSVLTCLRRADPATLGAGSSSTASATPAGRTYVPYRDSKMTHVLKECLNTDSFVMVINTVDGALESFEGTLASCKYASRIREHAQSVTMTSELPHQVNFYDSEGGDSDMEESLGMSMSSFGSSGRKQGFSTMDESDAELLELRKENKSLKTTIAHLQEERAELAHQLHESEMELTRVREERDQLRDWQAQRFDDVQRSSLEMQRLQEDLQFVSSKASEASKEREKLQQTMRNVDFNGSSDFQQAESLRRELISCKEETQTLRSKFQRAEIELDILRSKYEDERERARELQLQTEHWRREYTRMDHEKHDLRQQVLENVRDTDSTAVVLQQCQTELRETTQRLHEVESLNHNLQAALERAEREVTSLHVESRVREATSPLSSASPHRRSSSSESGSSSGKRTPSATELREQASQRSRSRSPGSSGSPGQSSSTFGGRRPSSLMTANPDLQPGVPDTYEDFPRSRHSPSQRSRSGRRSASPSSPSRQRHSPGGLEMTDLLESPHSGSPHSPTQDGLLQALRKMEETNRRLRLRVDELEREHSQWSSQRHLKESSQRLGESPGTLSSRMQSVLHEKDTATREAVHTRLLMQNAETESTELKHEVLNLRSKIDSRDTEIGNLQRAVAEYRAQLQRLQDEKEKLNRQLRLQSTPSPVSDTVAQRSLREVSEHRDRLEGSMMRQGHKIDELQEQLQMQLTKNRELGDEIQKVDAIRQKALENADGLAQELKELYGAMEEKEERLRDAERGEREALEIDRLISLHSTMLSTNPTSPHSRADHRDPLRVKVQHIIEECRHAKRKVALLEEERNELSTQRDALESDYSKTYQSLEDLRVESRSLQQRFTDSQQQLQEVTRNLGQSQADLHACEAENRRLSSDFQRLHEDLSQQISTNSSLEAQNFDLQRHANDTEQRAQTAEIKLEKSSELVTELKSELEQLQEKWRSVKQECDGERRQKENLLKELDFIKDSSMRAHEVLLQTLGVIDLSAGEAEEADEFESPEKMRRSTASLPPTLSPTRTLSRADLRTPSPARSAPSTLEQREIHRRESRERSLDELPVLSNSVLSNTRIVCRTLLETRERFKRSQASLDEAVAECRRVTVELEEKNLQLQSTRVKLQAVEASEEDLHQRFLKQQKQQALVEEALSACEREKHCAENDLHDLEKRYENQQENLQEVTEDRDTIKRKLWETESELQKNLSSLGNTSKELESVTEELERQRGRSRQLKEEAEELERRIQELTDENQELKMTIAEGETAVDRMSRERDHFERENGALTAEIEEVRDANVTLNSNVTELRGSLKEALDARNLAEEQFQDLRDEHRMKLDDLEMNVRLVEVLRRDLAAIQEDLDNLTVESQTNANRADELESARKRLTMENSDLKVELHREREHNGERIAVLENKESLLTRERDSLKDTVEILKQERESLSARLRTAEGQLFEVEADREALSLRLEEAERDLGEEQVENDALKNQLVKTEESLHQAEAEIQRLDDLSREQADLEAKLTGEVSSANHQIDEMAEEIRGLEAAIESKNAEIRDLSDLQERLSLALDKAQSESEHHRRDGDSLHQEVLHLRAEVQRWREDRDSISREFSRAKATMDQLQEENDDFRRQLTNMQALLSQRATEKERVVEDVMAKERELRQLYTIRDEDHRRAGELEKEVRRAHDEKKHLREELARLQVDLKVSQEEKVSLGIKYKSLKNDLERERQSNAKTAEELNHIISAFGLEGSSSSGGGGVVTSSRLRGSRY